MSLYRFCEFRGRKKATDYALLLIAYSSLLFWVGVLKTFWWTIHGHLFRMSLCTYSATLGEGKKLQGYGLLLIVLFCFGSGFH